MEISKLKVGQIVKHANGFIGEIVDIRHSEDDYPDIDIKVIDVCENGWRTLGEIYTAMPEFIVRIVKDIESENSTKFDEDISTNIKDIINEVEGSQSVKEKESVFECSVEGLKFKGTKYDYMVFIAGLVKLGKVSQ